MKFNRAYIFIAASSIALLLVLMLQLNWIFNTAKIKQELFHEKVEMILTKTIHALRSDTSTFSKIQNHIGESEQRKIDSLLKYYMKMYDVKITYTFNIQPTENSSINNFLNFNQNTCQACISEDDDKVKQNLSINFPSQQSYILAEMKSSFLISIALIVIVIVISWQTFLSVMKEKNIAEQTNDFLNNMTHEFKTPITNIALATKMITKELSIEQNEKQKKYTDIIQSENDKLKFQVEQILGMIELERGEIPLHQSKVNFDELLESAVQRMHLQFENCNAKINLELKAQNNSLLADAVHLNNAICNLLDNAIKYSSLNPIISVKTFNEHNNIVLTITDNGIGIDKSFHGKIFDKYFRVPTGNLHEVKGFGIGLAYTRFIIEKHGGAISLKSEKEKGTTFIISLPNA